jgi:hypothetical protein
MANYLEIDTGDITWSFCPLRCDALLFHWEVTLLLLEFVPRATRQAFAAW